MVFESLGTMMEQINFFGTGVFLLVAVLIFAVSRGLTKTKKELPLYFITFGMFATLTLFIKQSTYIVITLSIIAIIYSFTHFREENK